MDNGVGVLFIVCGALVALMALRLIACGLARGQEGMMGAGLIALLGLCILGAGVVMALHA